MLSDRFSVGGKATAGGLIRLESSRICNGCAFHLNSPGLAELARVRPPGRGEVDDQDLIRDAQCSDESGENANKVSEQHFPGQCTPFSLTGGVR